MKFANYRVLMMQSGKISRCCYILGNQVVKEGGSSLISKFTLY